MAQNDINKIKDHAELFHQDEYQELFAKKKEFEGGHAPDEVARIAEWTKTWEPRQSLPTSRSDPGCRRI
jgi:nitrogenase molybdenum-iron protein beta chain